MSKSTNNQRFNALFSWLASKNKFRFIQGIGWVKIKTKHERITEELE